MANNSVGGDSKVVPLGTGQKSSNAWLGIDSRIENGSLGARSTKASPKYGGDQEKGDLFYGTSAAKDSKESNSGGGSKDSKGSGQYFGDSAQGTVASRQEMTIGGDEAEGKLYGAGAGATKAVSPTDQLTRDLPAQAGMDVIKGTAGAQANMDKAMQGIRGGKGKL